MAITVKYIGTADNYAELSVTGKQSVWQVGQQEERSDVEAGQLLATGLFSSAPLPVMASTNLTGGIAISASGASVGGNAAPYAFTSRALADADNGMTLICASAQTATIPAGLPIGFGCAFDGAISFTAGGGVTITLDDRSTGATAPFCGLIQIGVNAFKILGKKA